MKRKMAFKPFRRMAAEAVRTHNKKMAKMVAKPTANIGRAVWRGLRFPLRPRENFCEMLHRLATAPFRVNLPGIKAGKT
jgi:hypothetical protein